MIPVSRRASACGLCLHHIPSSRLQRSHLIFFFNAMKFSTLLSSLLVVLPLLSQASGARVPLLVARRNGGKNKGQGKNGGNSGNGGVGNTTTTANTTTASNTTTSTNSTSTGANNSTVSIVNGGNAGNVTNTGGNANNSAAANTGDPQTSLSTSSVHGHSRRISYGS
jgi:hypothetical protein